MDVRPLLLPAILVASGCLSPGLANDPATTEFRVEFKNSREAPTVFRADGFNATGGLVWSWNQSIEPGAQVLTPVTLLPNGLYDLYAIAGNASCTRGPIRLDDPQARWWVELPELGRRHAPGGEVWPPSSLNCGLQTSS